MMRVCLVCGKSIEHKRTDAKFCGSNCRKRNNRRFEKIDKMKNQIIDLICQLHDMCDDDEIALCVTKAMVTINNYTDRDYAISEFEKSEYDKQSDIQDFLAWRENIISQS